MAPVVSKKFRPSTTDTRVAIIEAISMRTPSDAAGQSLFETLLEMVAVAIPVPPWDFSKI
ncbi:hypothetical protein [Novosphingobium colocasiae]|uniref:Uncharacterized protein n=1 Tax=Novosphingobium colocasiae TaxID=1256513 RepID=A0A918P907_9SPHN|nr:hypothetical protein [Novosphingobium colocasiae]GGY91642.1 hypothetical protein GCM10011614_02940 [Novosphingobium colocasiae]